jgi:type I restriction enzyme, S subunit
MTTSDWISQEFERLADSNNGTEELRSFILQLAVQGKLAPQDPDDEPASELLKRIEKEKQQLIAEGKIKKSKPLPPIGEDEIPLEIPENWAFARMGFLAKKITKGATPTTYGYQFIDKGISFIKIENIKNRVIIKDSIKQFISEEANANQSRSILESGDVLFSIAGTIGETCVVKSDDLPANVNQAIAIIKGTKSTFLSNFLLIQLNSFVANKAKSKARGGAMNNISLGDLNNLTLVIPPIKEQKRIAAKADELMNLCDAFEAKQTSKAELKEALNIAALDRINNAQSEEDLESATNFYIGQMDRLVTKAEAVKPLRETILQLAVQGKLVPQDPNDEPASELLKQIEKEKQQLIAEGKLKKSKPLPPIEEDEFYIKTPKSWAVVRIGSIFSLKTGFAFKSSSYVNKGTLVFRVTNFMRDGSYDLTNSVYYDSNNLDKKISSYLLEENEVVMVMVGGTIGKTTIIKKNLLPALLNQNMWRISCFSKSFCTKYTYLLINHINKTVSGLTNSTHGHFTMGEYKERTVAFPPLAEQKRIVAKVDELMAICDQLETKLTHSQSLNEKFTQAVLSSAP